MKTTNETIKNIAWLIFVGALSYYLYNNVYPFISNETKILMLKIIPLILMILSMLFLFFNFYKTKTAATDEEYHYYVKRINFALVGSLVSVMLLSFIMMNIDKMF